MFKAISYRRYRASAAERRLHGGKTVTVFLVTHGPTDIVREVRGYGPHPSTRKADALRRAEAVFADVLDRKEAGR